jgi:hypothetical protein
MDALRNYLKTIPPGPIADVTKLRELLAHCWHEFSGHDETSMEDHKVFRMEQAEWQPPKLGFVVERHGGTVMGSSRAELQGWMVDVTTKKAVCGVAGRRQLRPMQSRLDVSPLAEEIAGLILTHQPDKRLKWYTADRVRVQIGSILTHGSAAKETLTGRRKRFRKALKELLDSQGWNEGPVNVYSRSQS